MKTFTVEEIENVLDGLYEVGETTEEGLTPIDVGEWMDEGKYSCREVIFSFEDKFYGYYQSRSGSYFSDYHYDPIEPENVYEVKKVTKTVEVWEPV